MALDLVRIRYVEMALAVTKFTVFNRLPREQSKNKENRFSRREN